MTIENIKTLKELYKELYDILYKADIGDIIELDLRYESDAVSVTYEYDMWSYGSYSIKTYIIPFEVITDAILSVFGYDKYNHLVGDWRFMKKQF